MDRPTPDDPYAPERDFPRLSDPEGREYDALADLFLGDADLAPTPASVGRSTPPAKRDPLTRPPEATEGSAVRRVEPETALSARTVEAVLLGHLPVRASVWVRQYASNLATNMGRPVGLLRVNTESTSIELVGPGVDDLALGGLPQSGSASEALERAAGLADRWVVRVDETAEPGLAESAGVDEVTILTGADEAAIVASYRLVKSLASSWDRIFGEDAGPELSLAIMGSGGEQALAATEKLERAAEAFLNRDITISARIPKIGVATAATVFRGPGSGNADELVSVLKEERGATLRLADIGWSPADEPARDQHGAPQTQAASPQPEPADEPEASLGDLDANAFTSELIEFEPEGDAETGREPERETEREPEHAPARADDRPGKPEIVTRRVADITPRRVERDAAPVRDETPVVHAKTGAPSGATLIEGLTVLETTCPYASEVEFAADAEGRLHLVARDGVDGAIEAFRDLTAAAAWARTHLPLILRAEAALAHPASDDPASGEPVLHVIASDARAARPILDADVRVHLATPVELGGQRGWVACELN